MELKKILGFIVLFIFPSIVMAQDNQADLIRELYVKSGMQQQIEQMPMIMKVGFDQARSSDNHVKNLPPKVVQDMRQAIDMAFAPKDMQKIIMAEFKEKLSVNDLKQVLSWLASPLGQKFTKMEEEATSPEKYMEMQQYAKDIQKTPPSKERLELCHKLDSALKMTDSNVEVAINTQLAITFALVSSLPKEQQPPMDVLAARIEDARPDIKTELGKQTIVSLLYTYQKCSLKDLEKYISFASSPAGLNYHYTTMLGLKKALRECGFKWGKIIADIIGNSSPKTDA